MRNSPLVVVALPLVSPFRNCVSDRVSVSPFAGGERSVADLARYFQIDGLGASLSFDDLVKRSAV